MKAEQVVEESTMNENLGRTEHLDWKRGEGRRKTEIHTKTKIWAHDWEPWMMINGETEEIKRAKERMTNQVRRFRKLHAEKKQQDWQRHWREVAPTKPRPQQDTAQKSVTGAWQKSPTGAWQKT